jgi:predicted nucleic acid-binding protein
MHETDRRHWIAVGDLRRDLAAQGVNLTIPDAHIAQCAIDLDATLLTRDKVFKLVSRYVPLRLG